MSKEQKVSIQISATDKASLAMRKVGSEVVGLQKKLGDLKSSMSGGLGMLGLGTLGGVVGGGAIFSSAITSAGNFENALFQTTKVTNQSIESINKELQALPASLGSITQLTQGYYQVLSAGITEGTAALEMLTTASQLSKVAGVQQGDSIRALTKLMAGYRGEITNVSQAAGLLLDIEQLGQTTVAELIPHIGDLAVSSQTLGVSFQEMAAGLALLTQTNGSTGSAATQLRALEMSLLNGNEQMTAIVKSLGAANGRELISKNGLAGALHLIELAAKRSNIELAKVYGSQEAFLGANAISAGGFAAYRTNLEQVGQEAGRTKKSFDDFSGTFNGLRDESVAALQNVLTTLGMEFLPGVKQGLTDFTAYLKTNSGEVKQWGQDAAGTVQTLADNVADVVGFWRSLPDDVTGSAGYGIVGGLLFGKTGAALGLALSIVGPIKNSIAGAKAVYNGELAFSDYAFSGPKELSTLLVDVEKQRQLNQSGRQSVSAEGVVEGDWNTPDPMQVAAGKRSPSTIVSNYKQSEKERSFVGPHLPLSNEKSVPVQPPTPAVPAGSALPELQPGYKPVAPKGSNTQKSDSAHAYFDDLELEIAKLEGRSTNFDVSLAKKLKDIAKNADGAGLSVKQLGEIQGRYTAAANTQRLKDIDSAYRDLDITIAQMEGDTKTKKSLSLEKEIEVIRKKFEELKVPAEEAEQRITAFRVASEKQVNTENLQAQMQFFQDLARLSGDYSVSLELQDKIIAQQAEKYRFAFPELKTFVDEWERLQRLEISTDAFDGFERGFRKWMSDAGNAASQMESLTTGFLDGMTSAVEYANGKIVFSYDKMFNDLINMGLRFIQQQAASGLLGMIGGMLGGSAASSSPAIGVSGSLLSGIFNSYKYHSGGLVGDGGRPVWDHIANWQNAPRYHLGGDVGLNPGERRIIALDSEMVLNPAETRAYKAGRSAANYPLSAMSATAPQVINNISISPPSGYEAVEERTPNASGGEDVRITFSRMMAGEVSNYGSPLNRALRQQGMRTPVVRQG